jgi:sn-glycerol 3-phosphate transport system substrate-binding protein
MKVALQVLTGFWLLQGASGASAAIKIDWWHAMLGASHDVVERLAEDFNDTQDEYRVVPVFKGTYPETLAAGLAAATEGNPPHIVQVFDAGTGVMMQEEDAIVAAADVMQRAGVTFDANAYLPGIAAY